MGEREARLIDIVSCIGDNAEIGCRELAERFGVSERTIRSRIQQANRALEGCASIASKRGHGYTLHIESEQKFAAWTDGQRELRSNSLPATPRERMAFLLNDLLERSEWITLDDLADTLFVSRKVISRELREVEQRLATFELKLEKRPHYGIRVVGSELNRRLCMASVAIEQFERADSRCTEGEDASLDEVACRAGSEYRTLLSSVSACVSAGVVDGDLQIGAVALQNLIIHIAIAVLRIKNGCYIPLDADSLGEIKSSPEYESAQCLAQRIGARFGLELPEEEVAYIAIHLAGKQTIGDDAPDGVVDGEVWDLVTDMLEEVRRSYHFDFSDDLELRMNLARHLVPLLVRLRFHMSAHNPILRDIRQRFPLAYSMALDSVSVIRERTGKNLSEDETGYIAMAYAVALERRKSSQRRKVNVLLVCASGAGTSRLLAMRFTEHFSASIGEIRVCDAARVEREDLSAIDYVFTTVPLEANLPVPVCMVGQFLDERDALLVHRVLDGGEAALGNKVERAFCPELFFAHVQAEDKTAAIHLLCQAAQRHEDVPEDFEELVLHREDVAETSFGNGVALPHPYMPVSGRTFVAVALLEKPVSWNGHDVRAVFLISIIRDACEDLDAFYRCMSGLLTDRQSIARLVSDQRFEVLIELLGNGPAHGVEPARHGEEDWSGLLD